MITDYRTAHPGQDLWGEARLHPAVAGPTDQRLDHTFHYQYTAHWARRTLKGTGEPVAKAEKAFLCVTPVNGNRFVRRISGSKGVNGALPIIALGLQRQNSPAPTCTYLST